MIVAIKTVGVVGAGQMGSGIAHVCALAGFDVLLHDAAADRLEKGIATINGNMARQVASGKLLEDQRAAAMKLIRPANSMEDLAGVDLAIEAATEDETVKRKIFAQLCSVLNPEAILATNTSSISITRLASTTDRPERFIGIHFMNPVPVMKLVELVRGIATDEETFRKSNDFVTALGKTITVAEDFPAFIVNRILLHLSLHHAGSARRAGGFQVPAMSASGQICRSWLARTQGRPWLLRLSRRASGSDALRRTTVFMEEAGSNRPFSIVATIREAVEKLQHPYH